MIKEKIINKNNEVLITKNNIPLFKYKFEDGDLFIPKFNKYFKKDIETIDNKGNKKIITNYTIIASVKDKDGNIILNEERNREIFVSITPAHVKVIQKVKDQGINITQELWKAFEYTHEKYGKNISIGLKKDFVKAKTFEDFEKEKEDQ
jgi:hypothetical protein